MPCTNMNASYDASSSHQNASLTLDFYDKGERELSSFQSRVVHLKGECVYGFKRDWHASCTPDGVKVGALCTACLACG